MRKVLIILLMAVFLTGCGLQSNKAVSTVKPILGKVVSADFISSAVGWMSVENKDVGNGNSSIVVYQTDNGGKTWTKQLGFPAGGSPAAGWMRFFDADNGLVLGSEGKYFYHTTDGGYQWHTSNLPVPVNDLSMLTFCSPLNGWLLDITCGAMGSESAAIYRTVDGGSSWNICSTTSPINASVPGQLPAGGDKSGITFKGARTGWITGSVAALGGSWLFTSSDGGLRWQSLVFTLPQERNPAKKPPHLIFNPPPSWDQAEITTLPPRFISSQDGALPILINGTYLYLAFTQDGGLHWGTPVKLPGTYEGVTVPVWTFLNADNVMTVANGHLWATPNGGQSWTEFGLPPKMTVVAIGFINANLGWALACVGTSSSQEVDFMRTADGGRHWVIVPAVTR